MSGYSPVDPEEYEWQTDNPGHGKLTTHGFSTPDGINCTIGFQVSPSATCVGNNLPSIPRFCVPPKTSYGSNEMSTDLGLRPIGVPCTSNSHAKALPPFHTLTVYGVTCGIEDKGTTACKDPKGRAFVLSPKGSAWLPNG